MRTPVQLAALGAITVAAVWWIVDTPPAVQPAPTTTVAVTLATTTTVLPTTTSTTVPATVEAAALPPVLEDARCPEWTSVNLYVGFPEAELATADRVLYAESGCDLTAVNPADSNGGSWCAYQVNRIHEQRLLDAGVISSWDDLTTSMVACAAAAFNVWERAGWQAWSTY